MPLARYVALTYLITSIFTGLFVVLWNTSLNQTFAWWLPVYLPLRDNPRKRVAFGTVPHEFNTADTILLSMIPELTEAQDLEVYLISMSLTWAIATMLLLWLGRRRRGQRST